MLAMASGRSANSRAISAPRFEMALGVGCEQPAGAFERVILSRTQVSTSSTSRCASMACERRWLPPAGMPSRRAFSTMAWLRAPPRDHNGAAIRQRHCARPKMSTIVSSFIWRETNQTLRVFARHLQRGGAFLRLSRRAISCWSAGGTGSDSLARFSHQQRVAEAVGAGDLGADDRAHRRISSPPCGSAARRRRHCGRAAPWPASRVPPSVAIKASGSDAPSRKAECGAGVELDVGASVIHSFHETSAAVRW